MSRRTILMKQSVLWDSSFFYGHIFFKLSSHNHHISFKQPLEKGVTLHSNYVKRYRNEV